MTALDQVKFRSIQQAIAGVEDYATRRALIEIVSAVTQLQNIQLPARAVTSDGLPANEELSEQINGVFITLVSKGFADLIHEVSHKLGRTPQGCIFVRQRTSNNECLIEGDVDLGIPAATSTKVTFLIGDPVGQKVVGLLL
jgi:hypothetical protein